MLRELVLVASQEHRIAPLGQSHREETEWYKKTIQELTTKLDDKKKGRDDASENLGQPFKNLQQSMEYQAFRQSFPRSRG